MSIGFNSVVETICNEFDEMKREYEADIEEFWHEGESQCYTFCSVAFVPFIMRNLRESNASQLKKIFALVESLFENGDDMTINLANVGITEDIYLEEDFDTYKPIIYEICGRQTKESFEYWESGKHWESDEKKKT